MTAEELRGRRITLAIALVVGIPPILTLLVLLIMRRPASAIPWFQIGLPLALSVLLFRGYRWAKAYIVFSLCLGALLLLLGPVLSTTLTEAFVRSVVGVPLIVAYVTSIVLLLRSKTVEAYFDRQTHDRDELPSLRDLDGV